MENRKELISEEDYSRIKIVTEIIVENSKIALSNFILKELGFVVGQEIIGYFSYNTGNYKTSYHSGGHHKGILKQRENGIIYIESVDKFKFSYEVSSGFGRNKRTGWAYDLKHGIQEITSLT